MYDTEKAIEAQKELIISHHLPLSVSSYCYRCRQNIFAETGHPVVRLSGGRVKLLYDKTIPGITVECAGQDPICGCPFCYASFDD